MYNEKQLQIIGTAERLFAQKGFSGTSVRDIAEEAGVNIAMISYYFGSKDKLMQALFDERSTQVRMQIEALLKDDRLTPMEKIWVLVEDYVDRMAKRHHFHKIMICEQVMGKNPFIKAQIHELKLKNLQNIQLLIEQGQHKGHFRKEGIDVPLLVNTLVGTVSQAFISKDFSRTYYGLQDLDEAAFLQALKQKITNHIKAIFKAILTHEAQ